MIHEGSRMGTKNKRGYFRAISWIGANENVDSIYFEDLDYRN
jgi:hypothetical protein